MNLWARRIGQLLLVAPFIFACEEDTSLLGFKNPNSKFTVRYIEIPIESSNYLVDSISTSTFLSNGVSQFLLGEYNDADLGKVTAIPHSRFLPVSRDTIHHSSQFDSAFIELRYSYLAVGSTNGATDQTVEVFELMEPLEYDSLPYYQNRSLKAVIPTVLGTQTFSPDASKFKEELEKPASSRDTLILRIPIQDFGLDLFNRALDYSTGADPDSIYYFPDKFVQQYKGLAIHPVTGDKIMGFSFLDAFSRIGVYYHAPGDTVTRTLRFTFSPNSSSRVISFNHISSDRAGTEVDGISFYQDYFTSNDLRYSQSGIGIMTKLDFSNFFNLIDTIETINSSSDTVPRIVINSAELSMTDIQKTGDFNPASSYKLCVLKSNNRLQPVKTNADTLNLIAYSGWLAPDPDVARFPVFTAIGDLGNSAVVEYSSTNNSYSAFLSVFLQELSIAKANKNQFTEFALIPASIRINQDVSRFGVHKDNIKLKIYYTIPNFDNQ